MNELLREIAPVTARAWEEIDEEAVDALKVALGARRVVDFTGPLGWDVDSVSTGLTAPIDDTAVDGVAMCRRAPLPMVELRTPFSLRRAELDAIARGAKTADLQPVVDAARKIALAEDHTVFYGVPEIGIEGIVPNAAATLKISEDYEKYPKVVAEALSVLRVSGVQGPFALALGPRCYTGLTRTTVEGYPVIKHIEELIDGSVVWANGLDGALVLSQRGGDFELVAGRDLAIGYDSASADSVSFYIEESVTFRNLEPDAAVALRYSDSKGG